MKKLLFSFLVIGIGIFACTDNTTNEEIINADVTPVLPTEVYNYSILNLPVGSVPSGGILIDIIGPEPIGDFTNPVTDHGATLGRVLFYDKKLSLNNTISCGSCHHQNKGFADGQRFSKGFEGRLTTRNSMAIVNPITQNNLFWDSRSKSIGDLSLKPVQNHIEMGMENIDDLVVKLKNVEYYKPLFKDAFGSDEITKENISNALSQFIGSITSNRSKLDIATRNGFSEFSDLEKLGHEIFNSDKAKCSGCHGGATFSAQDGPNDPYGGGGGSVSGIKDMQGATNIGLDLEYKDNGVGNGRFKIPALRNIALTAPYMHDGRFATLDEVVNHYSSGIKPHKDLDPKFKDAQGHVLQMNLSSIEKKALVAFLHTLTDNEMIVNPKWSDPFKK